MDEQIEEADFILVICTKIYGDRFRGKVEAGKGLGVNWEGAIIALDLYEAGLRND